MATATGGLGLDSFGAAQLRQNWGWFVALGIALVILGMIALGSAVATTVVSVLLFGWLLIRHWRKPPSGGSKPKPHLRIVR